MKKANPITKKTTLAVLRSITTEHVETFCKILGFTGVSYLWKLESRHRDLTVEIALRAQKETAISADWLLAEDVSAPPVDDMGDAYTKETYDRRRAKIESGNLSSIPFYGSGIPGTIGARAEAIFHSAREKRDELLFQYKYNRALDDLEKEFGSKAEVEEGLRDTASAVLQLRYIFQEKREFASGKPIKEKYAIKEYEGTRKAFFRELAKLRKTYVSSPGHMLPYGPELLPVLEGVAKLMGIEPPTRFGHPYWADDRENDD